MKMSIQKQVVSGAKLSAGKGGKTHERGCPSSKGFPQALRDHIAVDGISFEVQRAKYLALSTNGRQDTRSRHGGPADQFQGRDHRRPAMPAEQGRGGQDGGLSAPICRLSGLRTVDNALRTFGQLSGCRRVREPAHRRGTRLWIWRRYASTRVSCRAGRRSVGLAQGAAPRPAAAGSG